MKSTRAVLLINAQSDSAVSPDAVIAACLSAAVLKAITDAFNTELADNSVRCNAVNGVSPFTGMVRAQSGVSYKRAICHFRSPYFLIYRVTGLMPF